mgnify:CR=1 FL=1
MSVKIALAGNPNCGKTTLFNILTGSNQYVGNWPGVTVEKKEGTARLEDKVLTRERVLVRRFELLFEEMGWSLEQVPAFNDQYEIFLGQGHYFLPGAEDLLKELAPRYDLYLATNGASEVQRGRLKSAGIEPYFKGIFISGEVGYNKPSAEYFQTVFAAISDFDPACAIIVGDSLTSDIRGGRNAGIRTCWLNPTGAEPHSGILPDYTVRTLEELPALFRTL